jgi:hypothetical protein
MMDERGVDSLPVALASSLIVLAIIVGLAAMGLQNARPMVSTSTVDGQILRLSDDCNAMLAGSPRDILDPASPPGSMKSFTLSLPPDTEYVAFGFDPGSPDASEGTIYYKVHGNKKAVVVDPLVRLRAAKGPGAMPAEGHKTIYGGGRYELTLEYEYDRAFNEKYIVVY